MVGNDEQLRIGDTLLAINGRPASSISAAELAQGMAGPNGSRVMVLVSMCGSAGGGVREVTLLRERPAGVECEVADMRDEGGSSAAAAAASAAAAVAAEGSCLQVSGDAHRKLEFDDELIPLPAAPGANSFPGLQMLLILMIRDQDLILAFRVCVRLPRLFVIAQYSRLHAVPHVAPALCCGTLAPKPVLACRLVGCLAVQCSSPCSSSPFPPSDCSKRQRVDDHAPTSTVALVSTTGCASDASLGSRSAPSPRGCLAHESRQADFDAFAQTVLEIQRERACAVASCSGERHEEDGDAREGGRKRHDGGACDGASSAAGQRSLENDGVAWVREEKAALEQKLVQTERALAVSNQTRRYARACACICAGICRCVLAAAAVYASWRRRRCRMDEHTGS